MIAQRLLQEHHRMFQDTVSRFVKQELLPHREAWEEMGTVPREVWLKAGAAGLLCCDMPEEYGGVGGDLLHNLVVTAAMTEAGGGGPGFATHSDIAAPYILHYGSAEQKQRWLPKTISGEAIVAIAMTEPSAGSDLAAMRTSATRDGDGYVINGQKVFISNGAQAHLVVLACKTDPVAGRNGISLFLVETDRPGFQCGKMLEKIGRKAQDTVELFFSDLRVPATSLLGEEGMGFKYLTSQLVQERLISAVRAIAVSERALKWTMDYVKERKAFGKSISEFQNTQFEMAELWAKLVMHTAYLDSSIEKHLNKELTMVDAAALKVLCTEFEGQLVDRCVQFFGGWGYMWEYPIARAYADARVDRISAGSNHILKNMIGRELLRK